MDLLTMDIGSKTCKNDKELELTQDKLTFHLQLWSQFRIWYG